MKGVLLVVVVIGFSSAGSQTCSDEEVPGCIFRCNDRDRPICAVPDNWTGNSRTFASVCKLNTYNCSCPSKRYINSYDGPCQPDCSDKIVCPRVRKPICAQPVNSRGNAKTFDNICSLSVHNCKESQKYKYWRTGEC